MYNSGYRIIDTKVKRAERTYEGQVLVTDGVNTKWFKLHENKTDKCKYAFGYICINRKRYYVDSHYNHGNPDKPILMIV